MNMKNKRGFTLTELLAAIVVLGIISAATFTTITRTLNTSRNKVYINDAKRLATYAEYQINANKSSIEKPKNGNCIVISLGYFQNDEFSTGPNGGKYSLDASFVVVTNDNQELKYTINLIEIIKNSGYKGIYNADSEELSKKDANKYIKTFQNDNLVRIDSITTCKKYS